ncbi:MAG: SPASM domain-containing protein [Limnochordia bacterium]
MCVFAETCNSAHIWEHGGDVYACDHLVFPEYRLGNIKESSLYRFVESPNSGSLAAWLAAATVSLTI